MTIKTGLRALALGAAMAYTSAEAATWTYSGTFEIPFNGVATHQATRTFSVAPGTGTYVEVQPSVSFLSVDIPIGWPGGIIWSADFYEATITPVGGSLFARDGFANDYGCYNIPCSGTRHQIPASLAFAPTTTSITVGVGILATWGGPFDTDIPGNLRVGWSYIIESDAQLLETPLPGALPLFASVLGIGGWLGYRRKRARREAVAAAA